MSEQSKKQGDDGHHKLSPSKTTRWLNCPGSVELVEKAPPETESSYASEGTLAHDAAALVLDNKVPLEHLCDRYSLAGRTINEEDVHYIGIYVDYVRNLIGKRKRGKRIYIEKKVKTSPFVPGGSGTLDCAVVDRENRTLDIIDLKYGKGVKVGAHNNPQLMLYALAMMKHCRKIEFEQVRLHIVQPRYPSISSWNFDEASRDRFIKKLDKVVNLIYSDRKKPLVPGDQQCQWCPVKGDCPALAEQYKQMLAVTEDTPDASKVINLTPEGIADILEKAPVVEKFIKALRQNAYETLSNGHSVPRHKLVRSRSRRKWSSDAKVELEFQLGDNAWEDRKLIGLTKAKQLMVDKGMTPDNAAKIINGNTETPEGKIVMAHEDDPRDAVTIECPF